MADERVSDELLTNAATGCRVYEHEVESMARELLAARAEIERLRAEADEERANALMWQETAAAKDEEIARLRAHYSRAATRALARFDRDAAELDRLRAERERTAAALCEALTRSDHSHGCSITAGGSTCDCWRRDAYAALDATTAAEPSEPASGAGSAAVLIAAAVRQRDTIARHLLTIVGTVATADPPAGHPKERDGVWRWHWLMCGILGYCQTELGVAHASGEDASGWREDAARMGFDWSHIRLVPCPDCNGTGVVETGQHSGGGPIDAPCERCGGTRCTDCGAVRLGVDSQTFVCRRCLGLSGVAERGEEPTR